MQFERFYSLNQSIVAWFAHLHHVGFQRKHSEYLFPPKLHPLILLGKRLGVSVVGKIKNCWNVFQCMKLEEWMA
jgi:hypothetical protein